MQWITTRDISLEDLAVRLNTPVTIDDPLKGSLRAFHRVIFNPSTTEPLKLMEKTISLGKIDLDEIGRKDNLVEVYLRLDKNKDNKPVFGIYGNIWNRIKSNTLCGGQCEDEINEHLKHDSTWKKIYSVWKNYHNNDLNAGSPKQEAFIKQLNPTADELNSFSDNYSYCCKELEKAGLLVDESYLHNGKPYRYGTAWIYQEIPDKGLEEIESLVNS